MANYYRMIIGHESAFDTKYREEGLFKQICDFRGNGEIMLYLSELKEKINEIETTGEDYKIVTRNRVGKEGRITFSKDPLTGKDDIKYVERDGVEISYDKEKAILFIDS